MAFWKLAYNMNWVTTEERPNGEITPEEYQGITGLQF